MTEPLRHDATPVTPEDPLEGGWPELEHGVAQITDDVALFYVAQGDPALPLVVLLHGFPEHWYGWRHQIPALVEAGYRVVAPDMRGYDRSSKPEAVDDYTPERIGDDVAALLDALGADTAIVIGHDWGGVAAWMFAMRHPARLAHLLVMNMPHPAVFARSWKTFRQKLRSFYFYFFRMRRFAAFVYRRFRAWPQRLMLWWFAKRKPAWRTLDPYATAALRPGAMKAMMTYYTALLARDPDAILESVTRIEAPVSVVWGTKDPAFAVALATPGDALVAAAGFHLERIEGAGHFLHLERPIEVTAAILRALSRR